MEVQSPATPNGVPPNSPVSAVDPVDVLEHIASLIQSMLGAARRDLEEVGSLLSKAKHAESLTKCARFANEPQVSLFAQKDPLKEAFANGYDEGHGMHFQPLQGQIAEFLKLLPNPPTPCRLPLPTYQPPLAPSLSSRPGLCL